MVVRLVVAPSSDCQLGPDPTTVASKRWKPEERPAVKKRLISVVLAGSAIATAGAVAFAVATSVSTRPEPAFVSRVVGHAASTTTRPAQDHVVMVPITRSMRPANPVPVVPGHP